MNILLTLYLLLFCCIVKALKAVKYATAFMAMESPLKSHLKGTKSVHFFALTLGTTILTTKAIFEMCMAFTPPFQSSICLIFAREKFTPMGLTVVKAPLKENNMFLHLKLFPPMGL